METTGILKLKYDTNVVSGKFKKREFVLTTEVDTTYPQHLQMQLTQDKCDILDSLNVGDMITVNFNLRGREWNGPQGIKYFNTLDALKIDLVPGSMRAQPIATETPAQPTAQENTTTAFDNNDDLPF